VPGNPRYQRLVRAQKNREESVDLQKQNQQLITQLGQEEQRKYMFVSRICQVIKENYKKYDQSSQIFLDQLAEKLDALLIRYLKMLQSLMLYDAYLRPENEKAINDAIVRTKKEMESETQRVREIKERRLSILLKRQEKFAKAKENQKVIKAQLETIEDVLKLLREQSLTMKDTTEMTSQLDSLVSEVEETEKTVVEIETMMGSLRESLGTEELGSEDVSSTGTRRRIPT
jgi:hypothetical protein